MRSVRACTVATHNLMNGLRLRRLIRHYQVLRDAVGLDVLCVQENRPTNRGLHGDHIAAALGPAYVHLTDPANPDVGIVYNRRRLRCMEQTVFPLPRPERLSWFERRYSGSSSPEHYAQLAVLEDRDGGDAFTVANFHLSTAGGTRHRRAQVELLADRIRAHGVPGRTVACGDTNAFCWNRHRQPAILDALLAPLTALGVSALDLPRPTHHFARQNEPKLTHQLAVLLGKLGIDIPLRYDVVCTNLPALDRGQAFTPDSDHDMVWAALAA